MENLFLQIFDRKNCIEDQLRQQAQSYYQSLASKLLVEGRNPPPWLWSAVSQGAGFGPPQDMCRQQLISGVLTSFPQAATPSVNRNLVFSQSILKDYTLQPNIFTGTRVPTIHTSNGIYQESEKLLCWGMHEGCNAMGDDTDATQVPGLSGQGQRLCTELQSHEKHERTEYTTKEILSGKGPSPETSSGVNFVNIDFVEYPSMLNSSSPSTLEYNSKVAHGKSVSPKLNNLKRSSQLSDQVGEDKILTPSDIHIKPISQNTCLVTQDRDKFISEDKELSANSRNPCRQRSVELLGISDGTSKGLDARKGTGPTIRSRNLSLNLDLDGSYVLNTSATSSGSKDKKSHSKSISSKQGDSGRSHQVSDQVDEVGIEEALDTDTQTNFMSKSFSPKLKNFKRSSQLSDQVGEDKILTPSYIQIKPISQNLDTCRVTQDRDKFISEDQELSANSQNPCQQRSAELHVMSDGTSKGLDAREGADPIMRSTNLSVNLDLDGSYVLNTPSRSSGSKDNKSHSKSISSKQGDSGRSHQVDEVGIEEALDTQTNFTSQNSDASPNVNHPACDIEDVPENGFSSSEFSIRGSPIMNAHAETRQSSVGCLNDSIDGNIHTSLQREKHPASPVLHDNISPVPGSNETTDFGLSNKDLTRNDTVTEDIINEYEETKMVWSVDNMEVDEVSESEYVKEPMDHLFNKDHHPGTFSSQNMLSIRNHEDLRAGTASVDVTKQGETLGLAVKDGALKDSLSDMPFGTNGCCNGIYTEETIESLVSMMNSDYSNNELRVIENCEASGKIQELQSVEIDAINTDTTLQVRTPIRSLSKKTSEGNFLLSHSSTHNKNQITALSSSSQVVASWDQNQSKGDEKSLIFDSFTKRAACSASVIGTPLSDPNERKQCLLMPDNTDTVLLSNSGEDVSITLSQDSKKYYSNDLCQQTTSSCNNITPRVSGISETKDENHESAVLNTEEPKTIGTIQPSESRYFLRRSARVCTSRKSSHSDRFGNAMSHNPCVTWPQERKRIRQSKNAFYTTTKINLKPDLGTSGCMDANQQNSSVNKSDISKETSSKLLPAMTKSPLEGTPSELRTYEDAPYVMEEDQSCQVMPELACSYEQSYHIPESDADANESRSAYDHCAYLKEFPLAEHLAGEFESCLKSSPAGKVENAVSSGSQPELEGFNFGAADLKDDITCTISECEFSLQKRSSFFEGVGASKNLHTPLCNASAKFTMHDFPSVYSSLPSGLLEQFNLSDSLPLNGGNSNLTKDGKVIHYYRNRVSDPDCYMRKGMSEDIHGQFFTPPIQKHYHNITLERSGCSSGKISSNPELVCFRIDENCSMDEEGVLPDKDEGIPEEAALSIENTATTSRTALADVTSLYQNAPAVVSTSGNHPERGSLDSVSTEAYFESELNDIKTIVKGKENPPSSCKNTSQKYAKALRNKPSKRKISAKEKDHEQSLARSTKKGKPSNIVANISSFVPLVQQKQTAAGPGKKDIKVKALEAAEVAKRLAEKKQKEREMRKEALRLERVKMEHENIKVIELERKQKEDERRKKEAQAEARKRLREEEAKKEKERKRRCNEARRQQHDDKMHNEKKELKPKDSARNFVKKEARTPSTSERGSEVIASARQLDLGKISVCGNDQHICDGGEASIEKYYLKRNLVIKESRDSESYEISPYRDSDNEDEDDNHRRKLIPKWARRESTALILASQKLTDLENVFSKKRSCSLDEVYQVPLRLGPFDRR